MQTEHFHESLFLASRLVENSQQDDAITVLRPLLECELHDLEKSIVCVNLAIISEQKYQESDALGWYDRAISYERAHGRFFATERKAAFMAAKGWSSDSLNMYQRLLDEPSLTDDDRERIEQNISLLKKTLGY